MKNRKFIFALSLAVVLSLSSLVLAQTTTTIASSTITPQDLIGGNPGTLPTSPFYFLKNWGWAIQNFFTFNPVAKAQLQLHIANVKAAEIAEMQQTMASNTVAIANALQNYENSVVQLQNQLQSLASSSQNPNVTTLLQKLADRAVQHEALFNELQNRFGSSTAIQDMIRQNSDHLDEILKEADSKDTNGDFGQTLSQAIANASSSAFGEHAIEVLSHLQEVLPEKAQEMAQQVQERIQERIQERMREASSTGLEASSSETETSSSEIEMMDQRMERQLEMLKEQTQQQNESQNHLQEQLQHQTQQQLEQQQHFQEQMMTGSSSDN